MPQIYGQRGKDFSFTLIQSLGTLLLQIYGQRGEDYCCTLIQSFRDIDTVNLWVEVNLWAEEKIYVAVQGH